MCNFANLAESRGPHGSAKAPDGLPQSRGGFAEATEKSVIQRVNLWPGSGIEITKSPNYKIAKFS